MRPFIPGGAETTILNPWLSGEITTRCPGEVRDFSFFFHNDFTIWRKETTDTLHKKII